MTIVIGIDPGATGAVATLDSNGRLLDVWDMPYDDGRVAAPRLASIIRDLSLLGDPVAWVEQAQSMPHQGVASSFKYGVGYGVILGVLGTLHVPTNHIRPAVWKKAAGLSKDKGASRRRATEQWPSMAERFARVKDDGRAEAALIARYGWQQIPNNPPTAMPWEPASA